MTDQGYDDNTVYSDKSALVWAVNNVYVLVQSPFEALASERMPDLVLSYVFTHNVEENLSEQHIRHSRVMAVPIREDEGNCMH